MGGLTRIVMHLHLLRSGSGKRCKIDSSLGSAFDASTPTPPLSMTIYDFYCPAYKLIVEVDGGYHTDPEQAQQDLERDSYLAQLGFHVLRVTNDEVLEELPLVLQKIKKATTA